MNVVIKEYDPRYLDDLRAVFFSSIRDNAKSYYTETQLNAWAPQQYDRDAWQNRIEGIQPFIATANGAVVGYADLQPDGYIDHFFVRGGLTGQGIGTHLMNWILEEANSRKIPILTSDVSLAAQKFFERFGFLVSERRIVLINSVELKNARMTKQILRKKD